MGGAQTHGNQFHELYDVVKERQDGTALLKHKKNKDEFILRHVGSNIQEQINGFMELVENRQKVKSPHLLQLIKIKKQQQKQVCSMLYKIYLLIEYPFKTLKDELEEKIQQGRKEPFGEAELWSILYSCCVGLNTLYKDKISHQSLTNDDIFINREGLIKISDPLLLGLEKNYIKVMKKSPQTAHISPEIMNFLDDCNFSFFDKEKSDIFVLGVILMEAALLQNIQLYDKKHKKPLLDKLPFFLQSVKQKYSQSLFEILQKMLQIHSRLRPTFQEIISKIQQQNSMCLEDQETISRNNSKSLKRDNSNHQMNSGKTKHQYLNPPVEYLQSAKPLSFNYSSNQPSVNKNQTTIIGRLNSTNFKNSNPPPPFNQNSSPQQNVNYPNIPYVQSNYRGQLDNSYNLTQYQGVTYQSNNQSFSQSSKFNQQKPFFNQNYNSQNNNSTNKPFQLSGYVQPKSSQEERFSEFKFGNINLDTIRSRNQQNTVKQPLFSSDIPGMSQLLKFNTSSANFNKNINASTYNTSGTVFNGQSSLNYSSNYSKYMPTISENPMMQKNLSTPNLIPTFSEGKKQQEKKYQTGYSYQQALVQNYGKRQQQLINNGSIKKTKKSEKSDEMSSQTPKLKGKDTLVEPLLDLVENDQSRKIITDQDINTEQNINQNENVKKEQNHKNQYFPNKNKFLRIEPKQQEPQQETRFVSMNLEGGGRYEGFMKNGMKHGEGRIQFRDGGFYTGEWKENKMNGYGKLHYENGNIAYEGNWIDDEFNGFGRVFNDRPQSLVGCFNWNDFADLGDRWVYYEGQFKNDSKHGKGKIKLTNGEVFEGTFIFDTIEGEGVFYTSQGEAINGVWKDNINVKSS